MERSGLSVRILFVLGLTPAFVPLCITHLNSRVLTGGKARAGKGHQSDTKPHKTKTARKRKCTQYLLPSLLTLSGCSLCWVLVPRDLYVCLHYRGLKGGETKESDSDGQQEDEEEDDSPTTKDPRMNDTTTKGQRSAAKKRKTMKPDTLIKNPCCLCGEVRQLLIPAPHGPVDCTHTLSPPSVRLCGQPVGSNKQHKCNEEDCQARGCYFHSLTCYSPFNHGRGAISKFTRNSTGSHLLCFSCPRNRHGGRRAVVLWWSVYCPPTRDGYATSKRDTHPMTRYTHSPHSGPHPTQDHWPHASGAASHLFFEYKSALDQTPTENSCPCSPLRM